MRQARNTTKAEKSAGSLVGRLKAALTRAFSPSAYHPEQHYMRGPGPKAQQTHKPDAKPH